MSVCIIGVKVCMGKGVCIIGVKVCMGKGVCIIGVLDNASVCVMRYFFPTHFFFLCMLPDFFPYCGVYMYLVVLYTVHTMMM